MIFNILANLSLALLLKNSGIICCRLSGFDCSILAIFVRYGFMRWAQKDHWIAQGWYKQCDPGPSFSAYNTCPANTQKPTIRVTTEVRRGNLNIISGQQTIFRAIQAWCGDIQTWFRAIQTWFQAFQVIQTLFRAIQAWCGDIQTWFRAI